MGQAYENLGRDADAKLANQQLLERLPVYLLQNPDDSRARMYYAVTLAGIGRADEAVRECATALELTPGDPLMLYNVACLYSRLGEIRRAIEALQQAVAAGYWNYGWMKHDPDLDPIRNEPEFEQLLQGR
jgi:tetratricopeptide (TPR) repeat protein